MLPKPQKTERWEEEKHVFKTDVMLGKNLKNYIQTVANYKKRYITVYCTENHNFARQ